MESKEEREQRLARRTANATLWKARSNNVVRYIPDFLINIAVLAIITLITLAATFKIDPDYITEPSYWITSIVLFFLYMLTHWSDYNSKVRSLRLNEENKAYMKAQKAEIDKATKTVEWRDYRTFFIQNRNLEQKKIAWETYIRKRIDKLTARAKDTDKDVENAVISDFQRNAYKDAPERLNALQSEMQANREANRYCQRKRALENMLTTEWIAENINKIRIDYNEVEIQFVENGNTYNGIAKDRKTSKGKYARDTAPSKLKWFILTAALTAIGIDSLSGTIVWASWLLLVMRLAGFVVNKISGAQYGEEYFQDLDIWNIDKRVEIAQEFKVWGLKKGIFKTN